MNVRAATLFFWGFLIAGAAVDGEDYRSATKIAIDSDGDDGREVSCAVQVHGEHKVIIRKEIEKTTN